MTELPDTNLSLIARVKNLEDGAAWAEFLGIYQPVVFRMARRRGLQDADVQDVLQQVFLSISKSIDGWEPGPTRPPFRAWLLTIARNAITKALTRKPRDSAAGSTTMLDVLHAQPNPQETSAELQAEARKEVVRWATEQIRSEFSETTWRIFWLTAIEGLPIAEVAESTGRSAGAVYVARFRVISRLKEKVMEVSQRWDLQESAL